MSIKIPKINHPGAALIVPFLGKGSFIILRQYRPVIKKYLYEFPAGTLEDNEKPASCARRELIEETGYRAGRLKLLGHIYPVPGYSTEKIFIYQAQGLEKVKAQPEKDEIISVRVVDKKQLLSLLRSGRIKDAKTICAISFLGKITI